MPNDLIRRPRDAATLLQGVSVAVGRGLVGRVLRAAGIGLLILASVGLALIILDDSDLVSDDLLLIPPMARPDLARDHGAAAPTTDSGPSGSVALGTAVGDRTVDTVALVEAVLQDTEAVWSDLFRKIGRPYEPPTLVMFREATLSECYAGMAVTGPFHCEADRRTYLDTAYLARVAAELGPHGRFAVAYIVAHQAGHHMQTVLGVLPHVARQQARTTRRLSNQLRLLIELQADCFAGVWARRALARLDDISDADIAIALQGVSVAGADLVERTAGRQQVLDGLAHGTGAQRLRWFRRGMDTGDLDGCDTFASAGRL